MKKDQVEVGKVYAATISGKRTRVQITEVCKVEQTRYRNARTYWRAKNLKTGKYVTIKSAMKLTPCLPPSSTRSTPLPRPEATKGAFPEASAPEAIGSPQSPFEAAPAKTVQRLAGEAARRGLLEAAMGRSLIEG